MSEVPTVKRTLGVNTVNGLGHIVLVDLPCDMGDHGRVHYPTSLAWGNDARIKFSWAHPANGNVIYREIDESK